MFKLKLWDSTYDVVPRWARYRNGRLALQFNDSETGEPLVRASINLVDEAMDPDEMALNHDFADVMAPFLMDAGIVGPAYRVVWPRGSMCSFKIFRIVGGPCGQEGTS